MECSEEIKKDPEAGAKWLVAEFGDRLFAVARRLGLNDYDAEDLVFRVLSQALAKIGTFDGKSSIYTWLYAIMMNFRRMDLRSRAANVLVPMAEVPESVDESPDPGEVLANISDAAALHAAVEALPETYREVVVFRYFYNNESHPVIFNGHTLTVGEDNFVYWVALNPADSGKVVVGSVEVYQGSVGFSNVDVEVKKCLASNSGSYFNEKLIDWPIKPADNVSFLLRPGTRRFCHLAPREDGLYLYTGLVILVR